METSRLAKAAIYCAVGSIISIPMALLFASLHSYLTIVFWSISILLAIAGFLLGIMAIVVIIFSRERLWGFMISFLAILFASAYLFLIGSILSSVRGRQESEKANMGTYNLRVLGNALIKYVENNKGYLPSADKWCDELMKYDKELTQADFRHPKPEEWQLKGECHFAFNSNLSGLRLDDISKDTVLIFEADGPWNLNGTSDLLRTRYDEHGYIALFYIDGKTYDYWYYKEAVRKFDTHGMYYEPPRWNP